MGQIVVDQSQHPILLLRFAESASDTEFTAYLAEMDRLLAMRLKRVVIIDGTASLRVTPTQQCLQARWMAHNTQILQTCCLSTIFVLSSPVMRGVLTAISWMIPIPTPYVVTASMVDAVRRAEAILRVHDLVPVHAAATMSG